MNKDSKLLAEAYNMVSEAYNYGAGGEQYPPKVVKGPTTKNVEGGVGRDYHIVFAGKNYIYRTIADKEGNITSEELYPELSDGKVQVSPGTNIAPYPSAAQRLKWFRKAASQSLTSAE
jgi:hypothetical protein